MNFKRIIFLSFRKIVLDIKIYRFTRFTVIPAKAGIQFARSMAKLITALFQKVSPKACVHSMNCHKFFCASPFWIPAFAGMTKSGRFAKVSYYNLGVLGFAQK